MSNDEKKEFLDSMCMALSFVGYAYFVISLVIGKV